MSAYHRIAAGRAMLAAESAGSGQPVVFLHAAICDRRMWRSQIDGVGTASKAIAYDRRGYGDTIAQQEDHSAIADLLAVLDALADGKPAILVGCSQGGRIAIDTALRHPDRVRALVLIDATVTGAPEPAIAPEIRGVMAQIKDAESARDLDRVNVLKARLFLDGALSPEGRVTGEARRLFLEMNGKALRAAPAGRDIDQPPAFDRLGAIKVPTLVIWGGFDLPHIQERARQVVARVANARGQEIAGAGHLPSFERPAEVTSLLVDFIKRLG